MELRPTIRGCDARWTMTISVDPLGPDETDEPTPKPPDFPPTSLLILDQLFRDAVDLYEYARDAGTHLL